MLPTCLLLKPALAQLGLPVLMLKLSLRFWSSLDLRGLFGHVRWLRAGCSCLLSTSFSPGVPDDTVHHQFSISAISFFVDLDCIHIVADFSSILRVGVAFLFRLLRLVLLLGSPSCMFGGLCGDGNSNGTARIYGL